MVSETRPYKSTKQHSKKFCKRDRAIVARHDRWKILSQMEVMKIEEEATRRVLEMLPEDRADATPPLPILAPTLLHSKILHDAPNLPTRQIDGSWRVSHLRSPQLLRST